MRRRDVLRAAGGAAIGGVASGVPSLLGCSETPPATTDGAAPAARDKRQLVLDLLDESRTPDYVPAAFFIHFAEDERVGPPAIAKHTQYFRYTGMDFVKIQYEAGFPLHPEIERPEDWAKMPRHGKEFYADQVGVVEGLVKALKKEALVVCTLYSPFMLARDSVGAERTIGHIEEEPEAVKKGLEAVTESLLTFVRECVRVGVDGFYASTQGGEAGRFSRPGLFRECVMPFDLRVQREINESCLFNILHICDYDLPYDDLSPFLEYPGDVVTSSLHVGEETLTPKELSEFFGRPFMGGLDRKGIIVNGTAEQIRQEVHDVLVDSSDRHILGADCTLPGDIAWENIRTAITAAHDFRG
jgi:uroporphyrinogen decarboxylase